MLWWEVDIQIFDKIIVQRHTNFFMACVMEYSNIHSNFSSYKSLNRKSLEDRNKESQEFYRSDSDNSINDDKEGSSKCQEEDNLEQDPNYTPAELTEAVFVQESVETTVAESMEVDNIESSKEDDVADSEPTEVVNFTEDLTEATNVIAAASNVDTEIIEGNLEIIL